MAVPFNNRFRFVVGTADGPQSSVWQVKVKRSQVYIFFSNFGAIQKLTLHTPRNCQLAFTSEFAKQRGMHDRTTNRWLRAETPASGTNCVAHVMSVKFPTDTLSAAKAIEGNVHWITPAPIGQATVLAFMFTSDEVTTLAELIVASSGALVSYMPVTNFEALAIAAFTCDWPTSLLRVPPSHHEKRQLLIAGDDLLNEGRPLRMQLLSQPNDEEALHAIEYGGRWQTL